MTEHTALISQHHHSDSYSATPDDAVSSMTEQRHAAQFNAHQLEYQQQQLYITDLGIAHPKQALVLHGGARSQDVFQELREYLYKTYAIGSIGLDCVGHGRSSGSFADSSLQSRTQQATAVLDHYQLEHLDVCIGVSMGAYNALQLSKIYPIRSLILIVPGVYTPEAYTVAFGETFRQIIRQPDSWLNSDAWEILNNFTGRLLIISAEQDEVVPAAIPERLYASANACEWKQHLVIPKAIHKGILQQIFLRPDQKQVFLQALKQCVAASAT